MNRQFDSFLHAIKAEWIKARRTFLPYSPIMFAVCTLVFAFFTAFYGITASTMQYIALHCASVCLLFFMFIFLPIYCTIIAIQNYQMEHGNRSWKHINSMPVSGITQALTKHFFAWCCVAAATLLFSVLTVLSLLTVKWLHPELNMGLNTSTFWLTICKLNVVIIIGGIVMVSIQNLISARFSKHIQTITTGFFGICVVPGLIFISSPIAPFLPWSTEVYVMHLLFGAAPRLSPVASYKPWWVIVPFVWLVATLALHAVLQRKRPLY